MKNAVLHSVLERGADGESAFQDQVLCVSLVCCATFCVGCMLVWAQAILKPLVFSVILVYLLSPLVRLLTTPVRLRAPASMRRSMQRRASSGLDDKNVDELIGLIEDGSTFTHSSWRNTSKQSEGLRVACPDWLAVVVVLALVFLLLSFVVNAFASGCSSLQDRFPVYRAELLTLLQTFTRWLERIEPRAKDVLLASLEKWLRDLPFPSIMEDTATAIFGGLESLVLISLFTVYLLQDPKGLSQLLVHEEIDRQLRRCHAAHPGHPPLRDLRHAALNLACAVLIPPCAWSVQCSLLILSPHLATAFVPPAPAACRLPMYAVTPNNPWPGTWCLRPSSASQRGLQ